MTLLGTGGQGNVLITIAGLAFLVIVARMLNLHKAKIKIYIKDSSNSYLINKINLRLYQGYNGLDDVF